MGVAARGGRIDGIAGVVHVAPAGVDDRAAVGPGTQRRIAPGVGEGVVGLAEAEVAVGRPAAVDEDVFVLDLADRRGFEEAEDALLVEVGDHVRDDLGALLDGAHRLGVELGAERLLEAPVAVDAAVVVDEGRRVEAQHARRAGRVLGIPVAHGEGAVRPVGAGDHAVAPGRLGVGIQVVGLLAVGGDLLHHVRGEEDVSPAVRVEGTPERVEAGLEDHAVEAPVAQVVHRGGPDHLVAAAVVGLLDVVRAVDIDAELPGPVGVLEHVGLPVGNVFPEREVGVGGGGAEAGQRAGAQCGAQAEKGSVFHGDGIQAKANVMLSGEFFVIFA